MLDTPRSQPPQLGLSVTDRLISTVLELSFDQLPSEVMERTKELVLDQLGVAIYGSTLEWSKMVRAVADAENAAGTSSVYGGAKVTARNAALVNGTAGHAMELDDTHDESLTHPGAVIIPAALAVAELTGASGRDFLTAVIAGYEVQCRIGAAISSRLVRRGFHPTAQLGVFGAAAAALRLMRLSRRQTIWAFGLAGSMASGIMKFTQDPEGTMVKRLHAGMAAERGLLAAQLAAKDFTGPRDVIEGNYGYASTLVEQDDLSRITLDLGTKFEVSNISVKLYPCCRMFHALIEAIAKCRARSNLSSDQIELIEAFGPDNMINGHLERRPRSTMSAQYSLPYTVAVAALADPSQPASFGDSMMVRADLLELADKVTGTADAELQALFPRKCPARVRFHLKDGTVIEETVLDSRSTPANPITRSDIEAKFHSVTRDIISMRAQSDIKAAVFALEDAPDLAKLGDLLRFR